MYTLYIDKTPLFGILIKNTNVRSIFSGFGDFNIFVHYCFTISSLLHWKLLQQNKKPTV